MTAIYVYQVEMSSAPLVAQVLRARRREKLGRLGFSIGFPLLLLALWQAAASAGAIDVRFFPSPIRIVATALDTLETPTERTIVASHLLATMWRLVIGYVLGAVLGVIVGVAMAVYMPLRASLVPIVYATFPTPKLAIFPLLIIMFGLGDASKVALVTLGVFYMTCINALAGVQYANPIFQDVAQAFRVPASTRWFKIIIPSALPSIVTGLKLGIGQALILVVSAEFVSSNDGLGYFIWNSWQILDISRMFMGLAIVSIIGGVAVIGGNMLERYLIPWAKH
jgi:ABC-type nitrate/sulfonate/bicarbonate transport system permease component